MSFLHPEMSGKTSLHVSLFYLSIEYIEFSKAQQWTFLLTIQTSSAYGESDRHLVNYSIMNKHSEHESVSAVFI